MYALMMKVLKFIDDIPRPALITILVLTGIFIGVSGYTFIYARGYSYLTNDPEACINCHVMREQYKSWRVGTHRSITCNDCHVPHDLIGKYYIKARNGYTHSFAFTFENVQTIHAKPISQRVIQANCLRCHEPTVTHIKTDNRFCFDCHSETWHTKK